METFISKLMDSIDALENSFKIVRNPIELNDAAEGNAVVMKSLVDCKSLLREEMERRLGHHL